jgi:hypothetical protein
MAAIILLAVVKAGMIGDLVSEAADIADTGVSLFI